MLSPDPIDATPPARTVERSAPVAKTRRRLTRVAAAAAAIAASTTVWATALWDADPSVRLARTTAPAPSTITASVESEQLSTTLVVRATFGYDGAEEASVAASPQTPELVATALPHIGDSLDEGDVAMTINGAPVIVLGGDLPMYRDLALGDAGPDVDQVRAALRRLGALDESAPEGAPLAPVDLAAYRNVASRAGYSIPELRPDRAVSLLSARHAVLDAQDSLARARSELARAARASGTDGDAAQQFTTASAELDARERDARAQAGRDEQRAALAAAELDERARRARERLAVLPADSEDAANLTDELAQLDRQRRAAALDAIERTETLQSSIESIERERQTTALQLQGSRRNQSDELTDRARQVTAAGRAVDAARAAHDLAVRDATTPIPAFGALFSAELPRTVVATQLRLGRAIEGPIATLAGARPVVTAELDERQREPIRPGLELTFTADADGREVGAVVEEIRALASSGSTSADSAGSPGDPSRRDATSPGSEGGASSQLVAVLADGSLTPPPGGSVAGVARVRTPVTSNPELVVPASALHLSVDGRDEIRVRSSAGPPRRVIVDVIAEVDGRVAVRPRVGELTVGDEAVLDVR